MLKVVWNIVKYFFGILQRLVYPAKRLICRRRKLSSSDIPELTSIGTGDGLQMTNSVSGSLLQNGADVEMEPWDSWGGDPGAQHGRQEHNNLYQEKPSSNGQGAMRGGHHGQQRLAEPEPEMDMNYFEDMTPAVQKQRKFLIRKKDTREQYSMSNRLAVMGEVPLQTSELESWEDTGGNAWEDNPESCEDMTWQAQEAIREKKKKDRMERQMEQQRKKQRKDEMRGLKGGSLAATKLS